MKVTPQTIIRLATPADQAAVRDLKRELWEHHHRNAPQLFRPYDQISAQPEPAFQADERLAVAERDGTVLGYARGVVRDFPLSYAYFPRRVATVLEIAVDPAARRTGLAKRLMADMLNWGRSEEATVFEIPVQGFNHEAIALYRSMGFNEGHIQMRMAL